MSEFYLVQLKEIREIPFPAVTICYDIHDWKWPGIVKSLANFDKNNSIVNLILGNSKMGLLKLKSVAINSMSYGYQKTSEYKTLKKETDMTIIEKIIPEGLKRFSKLLHFIAFSEQNIIWPISLLRYMIEDMNTLRYGRMMIMTDQV